MTERVKVRLAEQKDCDAILALMLELAEFEGYKDSFMVTQEALQQRLFINKDFCVLVALKQAQVIGILVYYYLPFTYDLKPWIYIKELFVSSGNRSLGVGKQLMQGLAQQAREQGCSKIRWDVLSTNLAAQSFYKSLGAEHDKTWALFSLSQEKIEQLV